MSGVVDSLTTLARSAAGTRAGTVAVVAARRETIVVRVGDVIAKAHAPGTDAAALARRLSVAGSAALDGIFVAPLRREPVPLETGRLATLWPAGEPVREEPPWRDAGRLLAALHDVAEDGSRSLPPCGAMARWTRSLSRLEERERGTEAAAHHAAVVRAAAETLSAPLHDAGANLHRSSQATLVHGDWHLGQLVRVASRSGEAWRLVDVDDLGAGDPAWDLARTAALFAVGLVPRPAWNSFVTGYVESNGRALRGAADPWQAIDLHARALTVQCAAAAVVRASVSGRALDESELRLVEGCRRIARL